MSFEDLRNLSDRELLAAVKCAAAGERRATAALIAVLAEVDARRLYLGEGCSSLFVYCTRVVHLSEHAAYGRIAAARASRRFPVVLELLTSGAITLTTVVLLAPHLTSDNHEALLEGARHKSKGDVEHLIACLHSQPDVAARIRRVSILTPPALALPVPESQPSSVVTGFAAAAAPPPAARRAMASSMAARSAVAPLAAERYLIRVTVSGEARAKLTRAQDLLRHVIPTGDPAAIIERALTTLVDQLERAKLGRVRTPGASRGGDKTSRHVPASVRRAVWTRGGGRCAFVGTEGRCAETGFLEFHHVEPYADGGKTTVENLSLRCRAHNAHEASRYFGQLGPDRVEDRATGGVLET